MLLIKKMFLHYFQPLTIYKEIECSKCIYDLPHWTEQFQSIGVGLGAIFAGLGGLKIASDWLRQTRLKRKVTRLNQRYPINELNKSYELVDTKNIPGKWWLIDKSTGTRHWVRNLETARDMGWSYNMVKQGISDKQLNKYKVGDSLDSRDL